MCNSKDDSGAITVIAAVMMTVLLGFAALGVDMGYWFDARHQLQSAADAAALAGCGVLIRTNDPGQADAAARDYANRNATGAGEGLVVEQVRVDTASTPWSVYVKVNRPVPSWFSRIAGFNGRVVHADAKAVKAGLIGARYLMPWSVPIIQDEDIDRCEVAVVDAGGNVITGPTTMSSTGPRRWEGQVTSPATAGGYNIRVRVYNIFGVYEYVGDSHGEQPAARLNVDAASYPFAAISVNGDYVSSDAPWSMTVNVKTKTPQTKVGLEVDGRKRFSMSGSGTDWSVVLTSSDIAFDDAITSTHDVDIYPGTSPDGRVDAYVHVRRSTDPFEAIETESIVASASVSIGVGVEFNEFDPASASPGKVYELRVSSGGVESGNFGEIDYGKIMHDTGYNLSECPVNPPGVDLGNNTRDWVETGYGGGVHIGDIIPMSPGLSGWTPTVVNDRIAQYGDIVTMPVVAKFEDKGTGRFDVIVRKFAAFRIVDVSDFHKGVIEAEFLQYVATPQMYGGGGGGSGTLFAPRLVSP